MTKYYYKPIVLIPYRDGGVLSMVKLEITEDKQFSGAWLFKAIRKFIKKNFGSVVDNAWVEEHCIIDGDVDKISSKEKMTDQEHEQLDLFAAQATQEFFNHENKDEGLAEVPAAPAGGAELPVQSVQDTARSGDK